MPKTGRNLSVARLLCPHALESLASLWHARATRRLPVARFSKFLVVGGLGVVVNTVLLALLYQMVHVPLTVASVIAVEASIIHNYLWNDRWTFARSSWALPRLLKFNTVSLAGLIITTGVLWTLVTYVHIAYLLANLVGIAIATVWNFAINSLWTWGVGRGTSPPPTQQ